MSDLLTKWRRALLLVAVFVAGALFGNLVVPLLIHYDVILTVDGSAPKGCENELGVYPYRFGPYRGHSDGAYQIPCDGRIYVSDTVQLHCRCS